MKTAVIHSFSIVLSLLVCSGFAQAQAKEPYPAKSKQTSASTAATAEASVSAATVEGFMKSMFGYDPSITWKVENISATEMPGVSKVDVLIGNQRSTTTFYVMPGGHFAIVGEVIPFGADPFAEAREMLKQKATGPSRGPADAAVTLVEFGDLQCPHCKAAQPVLDRVLAEMPNVRLIFENFPLPMHPWADEAATLGHCVAQQNQNQDAFWKYVQSVYDAQAEITEANAQQKLSELATAAGADAAKAEQCSKSPQAFLAVNSSVQLGKQLGVTGTPSVFLNGRKVTGIADIPYDTLKKMIDFAAQQQH